MVAVATGCGSEAGIRAGGTIMGETLTVYSALPDPAGAARDLVDGQKLALADAGGVAGAYKVNFASLDTAGRAGAVGAARQALADAQAVAVIGALGSAEARAVVPLLNGVGLLLVSPGAGDPGLTCPAEAGTPARYQPSGAPAFARLVGDDRALAEALVLAALGGAEGVAGADGGAGGAGADGSERAAGGEGGAGVGDEGRAGGVTVGLVAGRGQAGARLAALVRAAAARRGASVARGGASRSGAAVTIFAGTDPEERDRWRRRVAPGRLVAFLAPGTPGARDRPGDGLVLVSPTPPLAPAFDARFRGRFARAPGAGAVLGYEAMASVLDAIERAGPDAGRRQAVVDAYLRGPERHGVLGRYRIEPSGARSDPSFTASSNAGATVLRLDRGGCAP